MDKNRISRRAVLAGTAAIGATGLARFPALAAEPQWKKFTGTKLEVILAKGPRGDNLQKYVKEFTELTGIRAGRASTSSISAITCRSGSSRRAAGSPISRPT
jgi:hypothetical protein